MYSCSECLLPLSEACIRFLERMLNRFKLPRCLSQSLLLCLFLHLHFSRINGFKHGLGMLQLDIHGFASATFHFDLLGPPALGFLRCEEALTCRCLRTLLALELKNSYS